MRLGSTFDVTCPVCGADLRVFVETSPLLFERGECSVRLRPRIDHECVPPPSGGGEVVAA